MSEEEYRKLHKFITEELGIKCTLEELKRFPIEKVRRIIKDIIIRRMLREELGLKRIKVPRHPFQDRRRLRGMPEWLEPYVEMIKRRKGTKEAKGVALVYYKGEYRILPRVVLPLLREYKLIAVADHARELEDLYRRLTSGSSRDVEIPLPF